MPNICMQHMCALMLIDGHVTFESTHDIRRMKDAKVLAMRKRIELVADQALEKLRPEKHAIVTIYLKNGKQLSHHTKAVRGTTQNPMTRSEVEEKSLGLMVPVIGRKKSRELCDAIWNMEKITNMRDLRKLLRA